MNAIAHIGNVPVEEWLPFLVPVLALYLYGRRETRKRRAALRRLPYADASPDDPAVEHVLARWSKAGHAELSREHIPLFYPPGLDGASAAELAARIHSNPAAVEGLLDDLVELGYVDLDDAAGPDRRAWLTASGYDLVHTTEDALLSDREDRARVEGGS